jgi:hypothetical protein
MAGKRMRLFSVLVSANEAAQRAGIDLDPPGRRHLQLMVCTVAPSRAQAVRQFQAVLGYAAPTAAWLREYGYEDSGNETDLAFAATLPEDAVFGYPEGGTSTEPRVRLLPAEVRA